MVEQKRLTALIEIVQMLLVGVILAIFALVVIFLFSDHRAKPANPLPRLQDESGATVKSGS